jgi:hypothetical protein
VGLSASATAQLQSVCVLPNTTYLPCQVDAIATTFDGIIESQFQLILELYRPLQTVAVGDVVEFPVRVINYTRSTVPAGTRIVLLKDKYFKPAFVALPTALAPQEQATLTLRAAPHARVDYRSLQPTVALRVMAPGASERAVGAVLAEERFGLDFCDFTGELALLKPDEGNYNIYSLGGMGAGKSSLICTMATTVWHEDSVNSAASQVS